MTIEIHRPELEALIMDRMKAGAFQNCRRGYDAGLGNCAAARLCGTTAWRPHGCRSDCRHAVFPYREIEIEPARYRLPVRDVTF